MIKVVQDNGGAGETSGSLGGSLLDLIVRQGAQQMLAAALQAEVTASVEGSPTGPGTTACPTRSRAR